MARKPIFMIHKHHASKLHFDLRLEIEGKLKSWAMYELPLKPNNAIKAVQVPDHPFWYRHFEGVIPEGDYGAGPVMVWEKGLFTNFTRDINGKLIDAIECIKNGFMQVWFEGHKLNGGYIMIRISKKQNWLIVKMQDKFVLKGRMPKGWNNSVKSGLTLEEVFNKYTKTK